MGYPREVSWPAPGPQGTPVPLLDTLTVSQRTRACLPRLADRAGPSSDHPSCLLPAIPRSSVRGSSHRHYSTSRVPPPRVECATVFARPLVRSHPPRQTPQNPNLEPPSDRSPGARCPDLESTRISCRWWVRVGRGGRVDLREGEGEREGRGRCEYRLASVRFAAPADARLFLRFSTVCTAPECDMASRDSTREQGKRKEDRTSVGKTLGGGKSGDLWRLSTQLPSSSPKGNLPLFSAPFGPCSR